MGAARKPLTYLTELRLQENPFGAEGTQALAEACYAKTLSREVLLLSPEIRERLEEQVEEMRKGDTTKSHRYSLPSLRSPSPPGPGSRARRFSHVGPEGVLPRARDKHPSDHALNGATRASHAPRPNLTVRANSSMTTIMEFSPRRI